MFAFAPIAYRAEMEQADVLGYSARPTDHAAARANIDRFLDGLDNYNDGSIHHKLIPDVEKKLARDAAHLEFAESRTVRVRKCYDRLMSAMILPTARRTGGEARLRLEAASADKP